MDAPPHFICPITQLPMDDPVIAPDGTTYEREALMEWVARQYNDHLQRYGDRQGSVPFQPKLPTTGLVFDTNHLIPNRGLRDAIEIWRAGGSAGTAAVMPASATTINGGPPPPPLPTAAAHVTLLRAPTEKEKKGSVAAVEVAIPPPEEGFNTAEDASSPLPPLGARWPLARRRPLHLILVVDVSGSMAAVASRRNLDGEMEHLSNSVLDVVKYAARALAHVLTERGDRMSLVSFNNTARVVFSNRSVALPCGGGSNAAVLGDVDDSIDSLVAAGATNLGDGVRAGLQLAVDHFIGNRHQQQQQRAAAHQDGHVYEHADLLNVLMVLTDGQPNHGPSALDVLDAFKRGTAPAPGCVAAGNNNNNNNNSNGSAPQTVRIADIITQHTIVNTYAFGYGDSGAGLSSELMFCLARAGGGAFGYIPDISFLGTVFMHSVANLRHVAATATQAATAVAANSITTTARLGTSISTVPFGKATIALPGLFDSSPSKALTLTDAVAGLHAALNTATRAGATPTPTLFWSGSNPTGPDSEQALSNYGLWEAHVKDTAGPRTLVAQLVAAALVKLVIGGHKDFASKLFGNSNSNTTAAGQFPPTPAQLHALLAAAGCTAQQLALVPGLMQDLADQVEPALRPEYYVRWGKHYLLSFASAHLLQQCNNFKDLSVVMHRTPAILATYNAYSDTFNMLAPPKPSVSSGPSARPVVVFASGAMINDSRGPCVHEATPVLLADGQLVPAKEVRPHTRVRALTTRALAFLSAGNAQNGKGSGGCAIDTAFATFVEALVAAGLLVPSSSSAAALPLDAFTYAQALCALDREGACSGESMAAALRRTSPPAAKVMEAELRGSVVTIGHVIKTQCRRSTAQLILFPPSPPSPAADTTTAATDHCMNDDNTIANGCGSLLVTPWHPVLVRDHTADCPAAVKTTTTNNNTQHTDQREEQAQPREAPEAGQHRMGPKGGCQDCRLGGPYRWVHPIAAVGAVGYCPAVRCANVFSFAPLAAALPAETEPVFFAGGVATLLLAHGRTVKDYDPNNTRNGRVIDHPFFGTQRCLDGLSQTTTADSTSTRDGTHTITSGSTTAFLPDPVLKKDGLACAWDLQRRVQHE